MNFHAVPSLEHIALVKLALKAFYFTFSRYVKKRKRIDLKEDVFEENVKKYFVKLTLPETFKTKIKGFIKPIRLQILKCDSYYGKLLPDRYFENNLSKLQWTSQGTIDYQKTAQVIIQDKKLSPNVRFELACVNCLENDIKKIWSDENVNIRIYEEDPADFYRHKRLVKYWSDYMKNEMEINSAGAGSEFRNAVLNGNKAATVYFYRSLDFNDRQMAFRMLAPFVGWNYYSHFFIFNGIMEFRSGNYEYLDLKFFRHQLTDVWIFLLSQIGNEKQIVVIKRHVYDLLSGLLEWPWQCLFMRIVQNLWDFLSELNFFMLLELIVVKVDYCYDDFDYRHLLSEFWERSPENLKSYIIQHCNHLLVRLLAIEDKGNFSLILDYATDEEKTNFIFSDESYFFCNTLINEGKWDLLNFYIDHCIVSVDTRVKFKHELSQRIIFQKSNKKQKRNCLLKCLPNL